MNVRPIEKHEQLIAARVQGANIRRIERMTGIHRNTITRLIVHVGDVWTFVAIGAEAKRHTNALSRKRENPEATVARHFAWSNFMRPHNSLKNATPAVAAGVLPRHWTVQDLVTLVP